MFNNYNIKKILLVFWVLFFFISCDKPVEKPTKPQLVRKKIVAKVEKKTIAQESKTKDEKKPKSYIKPKSDVSAVNEKKVMPKPSDKSKKTKKEQLLPKSAISRTPKNMIRKMIATKATKKDKKAVVSKKPTIDKKTLKPTQEKKKPISKPTPKKDSMSLVQINKNTPYNPRGKIDPFIPLFKEKPILVSRNKRKRRIPRTPLEKIALSQLRLVAIIRAPSGNKACVEEASGKGYIIKKGDFIGLNSGKVVKILKDNIIIEEEVEDFAGDLKTRQKEIKLPKPTGD